MTIPREEFPRMVENIPAPGPLPETEGILRTAGQANFVDHTNDSVTVKIRTLGRLAAAVRPRIR